MHFAFLLLACTAPAVLGLDKSLPTTSGAIADSSLVPSSSPYATPVLPSAESSGEALDRQVFPILDRVFSDRGVKLGSYDAAGVSHALIDLTLDALIEAAVPLSNHRFDLTGVLVWLTS